MFENPAVALKERGADPNVLELAMLLNRRCHGSMEQTTLEGLKKAMNLLAPDEVLEERFEEWALDVQMRVLRPGDIALSEDDLVDRFSLIIWGSCENSNGTVTSYGDELKESNDRSIARETVKATTMAAVLETSTKVFFRCLRRALGSTMRRKLDWIASSQIFHKWADDQQYLLAEQLKFSSLAKGQLIFCLCRSNCRVRFF